MIEGRDAIRRDQNYTSVARPVDVAHLPSVALAEVLESCFAEGWGKGGREVHGHVGNLTLRDSVRLSSAPANPPQSMSRIVFDKVSKVYGNGTRALNGLDLAVEDGEFVVVTGPSGSGKTTLLRLIAGLEAPTEGRLSIDGADVTGAMPEERNVAMVFQNYACYPHLTVFENMAFSMRLEKLSDDVIKERVEEAAAWLQLGGVLGHAPRDLSGGQRQRVAVGRALVREPQIFLFDEPLSNLDTELRAHLRQVIRNRHEETGATTVYVTHIPAEAAGAGDRILELRDGCLVEQSCATGSGHPFSYAT